MSARRAPGKGGEPAPGTLRVGIYDAYLSTLGGGENFVAVLAELIEQELPEAEIELLTYERYATDVGTLAARFGVELGRTRVRLIEAAPRQHLRRLGPLQRFLHETDVTRVSRDYDLFVNNTIYSLSPAAARCSVYMCMFPRDPLPTALRLAPRRRRLLAAPYTLARRLLYHRWLGSYDLMLANSEYTRGWIRRFWGLDSRVLYPPVDTRPELRLDGKRRSILGIGRFFAGNHNKKHDVLIDSFAALRRAGVDDWELHLVGGRTDFPGTDDYIAGLERRAAGHPVRFHVDASRETLEGLLDASALFWHATGFGEDESREPEKVEHFGLSTVEAMTHGCVPLVYRSGGQPEIVEPGVDGFLWDRPQELVERTRELAADAGRREEIARAAHRSSQRYGRAAFRERARSLLGELLADGC